MSRQRKLSGGMKPIHHLIGVIEIISHQVPYPGLSAAGPLCVNCLVPASAFRFRPHFLSELLWPTQVADIGAVTGMAQLNPVLRLRVQRRFQFHFKETTALYLLPPFATEADH